MSESKHTRGDWKASGNGVHVYKGTVGECVAIAYSPSEDRAEAHANARLIAAAPRLLSACKSALAILDKQREECEAALTVMPVTRRRYERGPLATSLAAAIRLGEGR